MKIPEFVPGKFLATIFGVHERTIRKLADRGILIKCGPGRYDLARSVQNYIKDAKRAAPIAWDFEGFGGEGRQDR